MQNKHKLEMCPLENEWPDFHKSVKPTKSHIIPMNIGCSNSSTQQIKNKSNTNQIIKKCSHDNIIIIVNS